MAENKTEDKKAEEVEVKATAKKTAEKKEEGAAKADAAPKAEEVKKAAPKAKTFKKKEEKAYEEDELELAKEFKAEKENWEKGEEKSEDQDEDVQAILANSIQHQVVDPENFDWDQFEAGADGFSSDYSKGEKEELAKLYDTDTSEINESEVTQGTVVGITGRDVIVNLGFKADGLVSLSEFKDLPDLKIGDEVDVYIEKREDSNGELIVSRKKAKLVNAWTTIEDAYQNDKVVEAFVKRRTKGGLIVDLYGVECFLPGSQIDVKPIRDFDVFVNKKMEVKVVKINYTNDNVVVSHKVLIERDIEEQKLAILNNLEKGQVLEGTVKNITYFGVFVDLGGVDGLLHITDISWGRINHPEEVLKLDEKVNVVVLDFDEDKKRISLGMKQLTEHPWDSLPADVEVGSRVKGKIVNVADYGAFLEINPGVEGLIHVSEMSWSQHLRNPQDFLTVGDEIESVVLTLDREERKMSLGIKQLTEDTWTKQDTLTKYGVGTQHKGIVRNMTNFGLFLELEEGIDGLVHVSDLSWTKKIKHPSEFVKVGEELEVVVLELDVDNRRLALGHKQLEENPWDTFESVFEIGSVHKCTIIQKQDKGAFLELPYGIEGYASLKNVVKENGDVAEIGETLDFKVLEFNKEDRRIALSHYATYHDQVIEETPKKKGGKKGPAKKAAPEEKDTLGDLEALSSLKDKMKGN